MLLGRPFCAPRHPNDAQVAQRIPEDKKGIMLVLLFFIVLLLFLPWMLDGSRRVPERPPAPKNYKKTAKQELLDTDIVSQKDQREEIIAFKLSIPSVNKNKLDCPKPAEQPQREELQRTEHPKRNTKGH